MYRITLASTLCILPTIAFAYFDPGTGSLIIQAMIGAVAAITVFWGNMKAFARSLLSRVGGTTPDSESKAEDLTDDSMDTE